MTLPPGWKPPAAQLESLYLVTARVSRLSLVEYICVDPLSFLPCLILCSMAALAEPIRIKDLVEFDGVRGNDLVGYGLVVGLNGTGDGIRNAPFTEEIMANLLERLGANVTGEEFRPEERGGGLRDRCNLPPFARAGGRIDVTVSAIGDAKSLLGGTLVMTPLNGADGQIYAVAQGTIIAGGISAEGEAARVVQGVPTAGVIPSGARVEREVEFDFAGPPMCCAWHLKSRRFHHGRADRTGHKRRIWGARAAVMQDGGTVALDIAAIGMTVRRRMSLAG